MSAASLSCLRFTEVSVFSEDDDDVKMDEDPKPKGDKNDLSQYNLDDYDKESSSIGQYLLIGASRPR